MLPSPGCPSRSPLQLPGGWASPGSLFLLDELHRGSGTTQLLSGGAGPSFPRPLLFAPGLGAVTFFHRRAPDSRHGGSQIFPGEAPSPFLHLPRPFHRWSQRLWGLWVPSLPRSPSSVLGNGCIEADFTKLSLKATCLSPRPWDPPLPPAPPPHRKGMPSTPQIFWGIAPETPHAPMKGKLWRRYLEAQWGPQHISEARNEGSAHGPSLLLQLRVWELRSHRLPWGYLLL